MKIRAVVLIVLAGAVVLSFSHQYSRADSKPKTGSEAIGVVSVRRIFQDCKRNAQYRQEALAEQDRVVAELEKLAKEIEAEKAGLRTLKPASDDHLALTKEILEKQASLQVQREFYKQQMELKDQRWTEQLYKDILEQTSKVAKQKGLDLVFEKDEIDLPAPSANELMLAIRTHKVLYSEGCLDITEAVMAGLDGKD